MQCARGRFPATSSVSDGDYGLAKYERQTRPGWMLYHDSLYVLEVLSPDSLRDVIISLSHYSLALSNGETPPDFSSVSDQMARGVCLMLAQKIDRDDEAYRTRCMKNASSRRKQDRGGEAWSACGDGARISACPPE